MKTILVDAYHSLFLEQGMDNQLLEILESFENPKIVLTNADNNQIIEFGINNSPYPIFTLKHNPNKTDGGYYEKMLEHISVDAENCIYIEHNKEAVEQAKKLGITTHHFNKDIRDLVDLKKFIETNI